MIRMAPAPAGGDPGGEVFEEDTVGGVHAQRGRALEEAFGVGLAGADGRGRGPGRVGGGDEGARQTVERRQERGGSRDRDHSVGVGSHTGRASPRG